MSARTEKTHWTYSGAPADPETPLDKIVRNDERRLVSLEADGLPEIIGIGSLKYRTHHQPLPYHIHRDAIEIHICRTGSARFEIEGKSYNLLPGNICLVQPGVDHHLATVQKRQEYFWMLFRSKGLKQGFLGLNRSESSVLLRQLKSIDRFVFPSDKSLPGLFLDVETVLTGMSKGSERTLRLRTLITQILLKIIDCSGRQVRLRSPSELRSVIDDLCRHPEDNTAIPELARRAKMCECAFIAAFKKTTGLTPNAYRTALRVNAAKKMLSETDLRLIDIAYATGFSTAAHFSTVFRHETGMTPQNWRKQPPQAEGCQRFRKAL